MTIVSGGQALASDMLKSMNANGEMEMNASTELTIATGVIAPTQNFHRIDTEADAASDDLDTITLPSDASDGYWFVGRAENDGRTVVVKHNTGNIRCIGNADITLDDSHDWFLAVYDSNLTKWMAFGFVNVFNEIVYIGDTANANMTVGLTINQGAADNEALALKSSDVAHGMTDEAEADTFATIRKITGGTGGAHINGYDETSVALALAGNVTTVDTAKSGVANAAVRIFGRLKSGTGVGSMGANANLLTVGNNSGTQFILDSDGDSHQDVGTAWTNFDAENDADLLTALSVNVSREDDPIRQHLGEFLNTNRQRLEQLRLVTFNSDGHHFVNMSRLTMLLVGAVRQTNQRLARLEQLLLPAAHLPKTAGAG